MTPSKWIAHVLIAVAIGVASGVVVRFLDPPGGVVLPWILLAILWIGLLGWIWRESRKRQDT